MSRQSSVALAALVSAFTSARRSGLISQIWSLSTSEERASVSARMPPHQPVPITATSTCCTPVPFCYLCGSIRLQPVFPDHFCPLRGLAIHVGLELLRRGACHRDRADIAHARLDRGLG